MQGPFTYGALPPDQITLTLLTGPPPGTVWFIMVLLR